MAFIDWNDALSVKVPSVDREHKTLIGLINQLHEAMGQGKGKEVIGDTLNELVRYTKTHFKHEEDLMVKHAYPDYDAHKREHDAFVKKVTDTQNEFMQGNSMLSLKISSFLADWLKNHIMGTDQKYSSFFVEKRVI